jgi:hypothetical protein
MIEVLGRDAPREGYRVAVGDRRRLVGLVPDALIAAGMRLTGGQGHRTAYDPSTASSWPRRTETMPTEILMPALSPTMEEGTLARSGW